MTHEVKIGMTDYSVFVFIPDPASTDGSGKTGLVAANLTVSGSRMETDNDATVTDYTSTLNDLAALTTAHTDWGVKEISSTLAPGLYRLDIADAIFAAGAWTAVVYVMITTSAAAASPIQFHMIPQNPIDGVDVKSVAGTNQTARDLGASVLLSAGSGAGQLDFSSGVVKANLAQILGTALTETAGQIAAAFKKFFDIASPTSTMNIITTVTTTTTATNLTNAATAGDLTATMKASVNTEVVDGLSVDTYAEPAQGAPGATVSLAVKIGFLYKAWRNKKTQTATTLSVFNDDAATVDHKSTVSDDGVTATKGEFATGP